MTREQITLRARALVAEILKIDDEKVLTDAKLVEDLGADSLDLVDFAVTCEEEFGIEVSDEEAENLQTFGQLVELVTGKLGVPA